MAIEILTLEQAIENNGLKILVHGMAGSGKTILCATSGMTMILLSAESGLLSLKKFMRDNPKLSKLIKVIKIKSLDDLIEAREWLEGEKQMSDWLGLDSISEIAEQILANEKKNNKDPRAAYGNLTDKMLEELRKFRDLVGYNVIMTCKQVREVDADTERTRFVPSFPGRQVGPAVPYLFDEVFALRVEEEEGEDGETSEYRTLQTNRDVHYEAKDRSGELEMFEEANLKSILLKINPDYILLKDRDPEELISTNDFKASQLLEEEEEEEENSDDVEELENDSEETEEETEEKETEEEETEEEETEEETEEEEEEGEEPLVALKTVYFYHENSDAYIEIEKGEIIDDETQNTCDQITKKVFDAGVARKAAESKSKPKGKKNTSTKSKAVWRCCDCDHVAGDSEPDEGEECSECESTGFYESEN